MELIRCENGHYYEGISGQCPVCARMEANGTLDRINRLTTIYEVETNQPLYERKFQETSIGGTAGKTIGIMSAKTGKNPVVGWLAVIEGPEAGKDFRIHSDNNYIGRSEGMDICIRGDETVSGVNHAVLAYDRKGKAFYFVSMEGRNFCRVNGQTLIGAVQLKAYDEIEVGKTRLMFVPLCGEYFDWIKE